MGLTYSGLLYRRFGKAPLELFQDRDGKEFAKLGPSRYVSKAVIPMTEWAERQEEDSGTNEDIDLSMYDI
jgi:tRNA A37 threonylcarbamoyladenosine biosynthesis protein TsaE